MRKGLLMRAICLSGCSALEFWRSASARPLCEGSAEGRSSDFAAAPDVPAVLSRLAALPAALRLPVEVLVTDPSARRKSDRLKTRLCTLPLPASSIVRVNKDVSVVSPELCFLQLASVLSVHELIQLGFELCGTYAPSPAGVDGLRSRRAPLMDVGRLGTLLRAMPGAHGHVRAERAAEFVLADARSPMETLSSMLLGLPGRLGGKGLPKMVLNARIELDDQARKLAHKSYLECDLFWPQARLAVEYEGRKYHEGERNMASDKARANALRHMGIKVISLFDEHIRDEAAFDAIAADIARELGFRMRSRTYDEASRVRELRRAILVRQGGAEPAWPALRLDLPLVSETA